MGSRSSTMPSHIRPSSGLGLSAANSAQSTALKARIAEKRAELGGLRQLRDLSAGLVGQMQQLEEKLSTLNDGTQAVAEVMANWGTVLRAIATASSKVPASKIDVEENKLLPKTLVRIPVEHAEEARQAAEQAPDD